MTITAAFASLAVRDLPAAARWYESWLGPGASPMPGLMEWQFPGGGGLQVYLGPERAGHCSCTLVVDDIDAAARMLREVDGVGDVSTSRGTHADTVMIADPEGNSIAFAAPVSAPR